MPKSKYGPSGDRFAVYCKSLEGPDGLEYDVLPRQSLSTGSVRLAISACGVNFPDLLMTRGEYQLRPDLPFIPGMEVLGLVIQVSPDVGGFNV